MDSVFGQAETGRAPPQADIRAGTGSGTVADARAEQGQSASAVWRDALLALAIFAVDPAGIGGVLLRARAGPVRQRWIDQLKDRLGDFGPVRKIPLNVSDDRLIGGLDLAATLQTGKPVASRGLLAEADGKVMQVAMAERMDAGTAARIASVMDHGAVRVEREGFAQTLPSRFGLIACDEGAEDAEQPPGALAERLAIQIDLSSVPPHDTEGEQAKRARAIRLARQRLTQVTASDEILTALTSTAQALGVHSLRAPLLALKVAKAHAALNGVDDVRQDDAQVAARMVLTPRATQLPPAPEQDEPEQQEPQEQDQEEPEDNQQQEPEAQDQQDQPPEPPPQDDDTGSDDEDDQDAPSAEELAETVLAAAQSALQPGQLERLRDQMGRREQGAAGRAGALAKSRTRGRQVGTFRGEPSGQNKLDVMATLRAAAPWQPLRGRGLPGKGGTGGKLVVQPEDFRIKRLKHKTETATIFCVDASGSSALHRLAETKGAIELLLADCYVRRDKVALVAFRGMAAEVLLPPTRSLTRAKRSLASLPGGGGTPLAAGLNEAWVLADHANRRGETPVVILMTDGRANVAYDGGTDRTQAKSDAQAAARRLRATGITALLIDTSPRPRQSARELAGAMGGHYLPLPHADASALSQAVKTAEKSL
ncbi:magnesium chelatase ATPase subunit D [Rhodovibrio sodomensis]|uniref:Mg-protoporphyrin IX chelatase n=1 Tax=Rhodovibrio sodomensis TaxID=1088 RepID=A0ABS1DI43_9PROT|nr:magnesium chelatase ATPase subunit D [Rhodovibrio sodomensis]MBK1669767.1 magnesium chelatase ATPase subunit D [Rhodovibrio sodomensis]